MEGLTRIELASSVWKTEALPLSYSPESGKLGREIGVSIMGSGSLNDHT